MVLLDQQHAGKLAVGAGGGLEGHIVHAGDLAQVLFGGVQHLLHALLIGGRRQGVNGGKALQRGHLLVNAGVVLHGAGAKGIEAAVDAVNLLAKLGVVAGDIGLAHLRQGRRGIAAQGGGQGRFRHVAGRQKAAMAAGNALFKDQLHFASTSFTMAAVLSSASRVTFSVAHHRMPPSTLRPPRIPARDRAERTSSVLGISVTNSWKNAPE